MIIGWFLKYLFLCLMIMTLGAEGLRLLEGNEQGWISIAQTVDFVYSGSDLFAQSQQNLLGTMLETSALMVFLICWLAILALTAKRSR